VSGEFTGDKDEDDEDEHEDPEVKTPNFLNRSAFAFCSVSICGVPSSPFPLPPFHLSLNPNQTTSSNPGITAQDIQLLKAYYAPFAKNPHA
jgi:hypothetical protein